MRVKIIAEHNCSPQILWLVNTDWGYFEEFTSGYVNFHGLPKGKMFKGQKITIQSAPKNADKFMHWNIEFIECDEEKLMFETIESGGPVVYWHHVAKIEKTEAGARLIDEIEIKARLIDDINFGTTIMSWIYAMWAKSYYKARIAPRQKIIERLIADENQS